MGCTFQREAACWRLASYVHNRSVASHGAVASKRPPTAQRHTSGWRQATTVLPRAFCGSQLAGEGSVHAQRSFASKLAPTLFGQNHQRLCEHSELLPGGRRSWPGGAPLACDLVRSGSKSGDLVFPGTPREPSCYRFPADSGQADHRPVTPTRFGQNHKQLCEHPELLPGGL
jgi:hypothetical protein